MKTINLLLTAVCFLTSTLFTQSPINFSGKWIFNQSKSKAAEGTSFSGSEVILEISQNQDSVKITKIIKTPGGVNIDTTFDAFVLDSKEKVTKEASLVTKRTGKWSVDKKKIILSKTVSLGSNVYTTEDTYTLSDNGKVLTIKSSEIMNSKKGNILLVYNKR